jgi:hypothetical protein
MVQASPGAPEDRQAAKTRAPCARPAKELSDAPFDRRMPQPRCLASGDALKNLNGSCVVGREPDYCDVSRASYLVPLIEVARSS